MNQAQELVTFYAKDEALPIFLSAIMGLQHAFAMVCHHRPNSAVKASAFPRQSLK
jgi:hypothetical protein